MSTTCAGVHFGNTSCVISVHKDGKVQTCSNEVGERVTPAVVAYTGAEKIIGLPAKQYMIRNPKCCITNIMSAIGQSYSEEHVKQIKSRCSCEIVNEKGSIGYQVLVKGDDEDIEDKEINVSPVKAASYVFIKLLEIGESLGGDELEDLVITVPKSFSEEQRLALHEAAEEIGCNILRMISKPAAACLAYGIGQEDPTESCNVLVFRLGGTSSTVSVVAVNSGMYRLVAENTCDDFGSNHFDKAIQKYACDDFYRKYKLDVRESRRAVNKLTASLEECKKGLSSAQTNQCIMDALYEGIDYTLQLNRSKFESLVSVEIRRCTQLIDVVLSENKMVPSDIQKVILVGGGCNTPRIQQVIADKLPAAQLLNSIPPEEVLAEGAARQAAILQGRDDTAVDVAAIDCISKNIGFQTISDDGSAVLHVVLEKNTPVPLRRSQTFHIDQDQTSLVLNLHESEDATLAGGKQIAQISLKDLKTDKEEKEIQTDFEINRNGNLLVSVTEKSTNRTSKISIDIRAA